MFSNKIFGLASVALVSMLLSGCEASKPAPAPVVPLKAYSAYAPSAQTSVTITSMKKSQKHGQYSPSRASDIFLTLSTNKEIKDSFIVTPAGEKYDYFVSSSSSTTDADGVTLVTNYGLTFVVAKSDTNLKLIIPNGEVIEFDASQAVE